MALSIQIFMYKKIKEKIKRNWIILICIIFIFVFLLTGFYYYGMKDFLLNLLAEGTGIFVSILIAIILIDKYKYEQRAKIRTLTTNAIKENLCDLANNIYSIIYVPPRCEMIEIRLICLTKSDDVNEVLSGFNRIKDKIIMLENIITKDSEDIEEIADRVIKWYELNEWILNEIQSGLTGELEKSSEDQEAINVLHEFNSAKRGLQKEFINFRYIHSCGNSDWMLLRFLLRKIIILLEKMEVLYKILSK
jgi:hypothetical protein